MYRNHRLNFMHRSFLLATFLLLAVHATSQPQLRYMIPDIGTTAFTTYAEFIGAFDKPGAFGADSLSLNNTGDKVRVRCANDADTNKIKLGPCVVSWNGRMISTHIFVMRDVFPNSEDWDKLAPAFRIPIVIEVNGQRSNVDTFYIVKPWPLGNISSNGERMLGSGTLGKRSRRGALLVDSLVLAGSVNNVPSAYNVSTADCDPRTPGNQGYLPFTLLAVGQVRGLNGAQLHADATGVNGGPGGGGGGGGFENYITGGAGGTNGGNGFTGGGPGGANNSIGGSNRRKPGVGSGEEILSGNSNTHGSAALNGVFGGEALTSYENAGGGIGHPFGSGGIGCSVKNSCNPDGGYGGGSGYQEGKRGAGGGYGSAGKAENNAKGGGKAHGNMAMVPLAGGSGGASGNPGVFDRSGAGGGGGGAISIHAMRLSNFDAYAYGHFASRENAAGGAGSGGGIILGSRLANGAFGAVSAQPFPQDQTGTLNGGDGRRRYDVRDVPLDAQYYNGPVSDTLSRSLRRMKLLGYGNGNNIVVFWRGRDGSWEAGDTISGYGSSWAADVFFASKDSTFLISVAQQIPSPSNLPYLTEPSWVLSQSANNNIRLFGPPVIDAPSSVLLDTAACPNVVVRDTIWIRNSGESPLEITQPTIAGAPGFTLVQPTVFPDTVAAYDQKPYIVEFTAQVGQLGPISATLSLPTNDTIAGHDPWVITLNTEVQQREVQFIWRGITTQDTIDYGTICVGVGTSEDVTIKTTGTISTTLQSIVSTNIGVVVASGTLPFVLVPPDGVRNVRITVTAKQLGTVVVPVFVQLAECSIPRTLYVRFEGVLPSLTVVGTGQFASTRVGDTKSVTVEVRNDGTSDLDIPSLPTVAPPFAILSALPQPPVVLRPGSSMMVQISYSPSAVGDDSAVLVFASAVTGRSCADSAYLVLSGKAIQSSIQLSATSIDLGVIQRCTRKRDSVVVRNSGTTTFSVLYPGFINGPDAASFTMIYQPTQDVSLAPGASVSYVVEYNASGSLDGVKSAILSIRTDDPSYLSIDVPISVQQVPLAITGPALVDIGVTQLNTPRLTQVSYTNSTGGDVRIVAVRSSSPDVVVTPQSVTIATAASQQFDITYTPTASGLTSAVLWFVYDAPCKDSFMVAVQGQGVNGIVNAPTALTFGNVSCVVKQDSIVYTNASALPISLIDVSVIGADASLVTITNQSTFIATALAPGEARALQISFDAQQTVDGPKRATIVVRATINNAPTSIRTDVFAERQTQLPGAPNAIAFGAIDIASTSQQRLTLFNTTSAPIRITGVTLKGTSSGAFAVAATAPIVIAPGTGYDVIVSFSPAAEQQYRDSIVFTIDQPCADERIVPLSGSGRLNIQVEIRMPDLIADPRAKNFAIPVSGYIVLGAPNASNIQISLSIKYITSTFVAKSVEGGVITRNESIGGITYLDMDVSGLKFSSTLDTLFNIIGDVTLGDVDSTSLEVVDATLLLSGSVPNIRRYDGSLMLAICRQGDDRLLRSVGGLILRADPNPATSTVAITADVFEPGLHRIDIVDVTGQVVATSSWEHRSGDAVYTMPLDVESVSAGSYHVILTTPTRRRTAPLHIIH